VLSRPRYLLKHPRHVQCRASPAGQSSSSRPPPKCYYCGGIGHLARDRHSYRTDSSRSLSPGVRCLHSNNTWAVGDWMTTALQAKLYSTAHVVSSGTTPESFRCPVTIRSESQATGVAYHKLLAIVLILLAELAELTIRTTATQSVAKRISVWSSTANRQSAFWTLVLTLPSYRRRLSLDSGWNPRLGVFELQTAQL